MLKSGFAGLVLALLGGGPVSAQPHIGECPVFPADNIWNTPVTGLPVDPRSADYAASIGADVPLRADFASALEGGVPIGIPFANARPQHAKVEIRFAGFADEPVPYADESDPGPAPIPPGAPIEGGLASQDDRHVIVVQQQSCTLYELYRAVPNPDGSWNAVGAARFDLESNELRPDGWTSADAAGLPIFPGLARYDEVAAGEIGHALRFTAPRSRDAWVWPARHAASASDDPGLPPMGQRFRLRADYDISGASRDSQVILRALQVYGMILADNSSGWFLSGTPDARWNDEAIQRDIRRLRPADFEAVDVSGLRLEADSGAARQ